MADDVIKTDQAADQPQAAFPQDSAADEELLALLDQRTSPYILLSRLYLKEVDAQLLDELHEMCYPMATGDDDVDTGYLYIATFLSNLWAESLTELAVDYARTFIGHGNTAYSCAYPYESVYTSPTRMVMQDARDEVLAIYRAAGREKSADFKEYEDHLALELEFVGWLCTQCAQALTAGDEEAAFGLAVQQRNFLEGHLLNWIPMMLADLERFAKTDFYQGQSSTVTFPTFRYAEIYLNYIEAVLECQAAGVSGNDVDYDLAMGYWDDLRNRSGMAPILQVYPQATTAELINLVHRERQVELAQEGHRYFDTRTWMIAPDVCNGPVYGLDTDVVGSRNATVVPTEMWTRKVMEKRVFRSNHYLYPFLQRELDRNKVLTQNYGW